MLILRALPLHQNELNWIRAIQKHGPGSQVMTCNKAQSLQKQCVSGAFLNIYWQGHDIMQTSQPHAPQHWTHTSLSLVAHFLTSYTSIVTWLLPLEIFSYIYLWRIFVMYFVCYRQKNIKEIRTEINRMDIYIITSNNSRIKYNMCVGNGYDLKSSKTSIISHMIKINYEENCKAKDQPRVLALQLVKAVCFAILMINPTKQMRPRDKWDSSY